MGLREVASLTGLNCEGELQASPDESACRPDLYWVTLMVFRFLQLPTTDPAAGHLEGTHFQY